jgi:AcrR family transcriptional regulator
VPSAITETAAAERRERILQAARWCFLNFGFSKTSFEDIAKRANISRTLLYKVFKVALACVTKVLGDKGRAKVFLLSLDGLLGDEPTATVLERRLAILAKTFILSPRVESRSKTSTRAARRR